MIILRTNTKKEFEIEWIGVADFDGCLRFEIADAADRMPELFAAFSDPNETETLTRVFDEDERRIEEDERGKTFEEDDSTGIIPGRLELLYTGIIPGRLELLYTGIIPGRLELEVEPNGLKLE